MRVRIPIVEKTVKTVKITFGRGQNKLAMLGGVHFAKIRLGKIHFDYDNDDESVRYSYGGFSFC